MHGSDASQLLQISSAGSTKHGHEGSPRLTTSCFGQHFGFLWFHAGWGVHMPITTSLPASHAHTSRHQCRLPLIPHYHLRQSKTDQFGAGMTLYLGRTGDKLCPVAAVLAYLAIRPSSAGPLFICADGSTLSRPKLVRYLRQTLQVAGIDATLFSGHSFQIGVATAARQGLSDSLIQTFGRWKSSAFTSYIRIPPQNLASISSALISQPPNITPPQSSQQ